VSDFDPCHSFTIVDGPKTAQVAKHHLSLLLIRKGDFKDAIAPLASSFGQKEIPPQIKIALELARLRVPLLPSEIPFARRATPLCWRSCSSYHTKRFSEGARCISFPIARLS